MPSTIQWLGGALPQAQVNTLTVGGTAAVSQTYTVTINSKNVTYTATGTDTNTTITSSLLALLQASIIPEFLEVTWAAGSAALTITGTAVKAGKPFTNTSSASGTGTLVTAITTTSAGPNDWSIATNWSTGAVPVTGDTVYIEEITTDILYGLNQSTVVLAALYIYASFTGKLGLPVTNTDGGTSLAYGEYRPTYLAIQASILEIGRGNGTGCGRCKVDLGSATASTITIYNSGTAADDPLETILLKGTNAGNSMTIDRGSCGVAVLPGETANLSGGLTIGYLNSVDSDVTLRTLTGVTLPSTVNKNGGTWTVWSNLGTFNHRGGTTNILGTATVTTMFLWRGTVFYRSSGTMTSVFVSGGGEGATLDFTQDDRARTVTNAYAYYGSTINDPKQTVTWTNGIDMKQLKVTFQGDFTGVLGFNIKISVGTVSSNP